MFGAFADTLQVGEDLAGLSSGVIATDQLAVLVECGRPATKWRRPELMTRWEK
jgi:hypothetical protein